MGEARSLAFFRMQNALAERALRRGRKLSSSEKLANLFSNLNNEEDAMTEIFVFGSNLAGRHGKGAALHARVNNGAVYGIGEGPTGNAYAIPTKDRALRSLPLDKIEPFVRAFCRYAHERPHLTFNVTAIGTGLAGYKHMDIAPMFREAPPNCRLPAEWSAILGRSNPDA